MNLNERLRALQERAGFGRTAVQDIHIHLDAVVEWLCYAQDITVDDGVSQT